MTHLTDEAILAVRDNEPVAGEELAHVAECAVCAEALEDARARARAVEQALAALTVPLPVERPEEDSVIPIGRGRRRAVPGTSRGASLTLRWLSRAAVLVLIGAGALSALPGPFNGWIPRVFSGAGVGDVTIEPATQAVDQVGGRMDVATGPVAVRLEGVPPGTLIDVRPGAGGAVGVLAGTGSEFSYGSGEVRASVVGGPVTVELPVGVVPATLVVNGGIYLVVSATGVEVLGPLTTSNEESLVTFRVPN